MPYVKRNFEIEIKNEFHPIELDETNVNNVYSRCLASEEEIKAKQDLVLAQCLMKKYTGIDSDLSVFSKPKIQANEKSIKFLLGQLDYIDDFILLYLTTMKNYNNSYWTDSEKQIQKLLDLGIATGFFFPFSLDMFNSLAAHQQRIIEPTLSPNDPNFPAWWAEHKKEWIPEESKTPDEK